MKTGSALAQSSMVIPVLRGAQNLLRGCNHGMEMTTLDHRIPQISPVGLGFGPDLGHRSSNQDSRGNQDIRRIQDRMGRPIPTQAGNLLRRPGHRRRSRAPPPARFPARPTLIPSPRHPPRAALSPLLYRTRPPPPRQRLQVAPNHPNPPQPRTTGQTTL